MMSTPDRSLRYAPTPGYGGGYHDDYLYSNVRPPPPRPPGLMRMYHDADRLGLQSSDYRFGDLPWWRDRREIRHFSCWRLRWCAFCLVVATAVQSSRVGVQLQLAFSPSAPETNGVDVIGSTLLLALLLVALWSLLSQLLMWSDAAVMKVPEGVTVRDATRGTKEDDVDRIVA